MHEDALSVIVCGSSAAISVPAYLVWLRNETNRTVRVLLTCSAERFVARHVVRWHADEVYTSQDPALNPIEFAKRSAGIVVLPATANMLAAVALGLAATPAQTALLASDRPALFFPHMNVSMWAKSSVQRYLAALCADGHTVVQPQQREIFELSRRHMSTGPALPTPGEVAATVVKWVDGSSPAVEPVK